jgi:hypothetical protein
MGFSAIFPTMKCVRLFLASAVLMCASACKNVEPAPGNHVNMPPTMACPVQNDPACMGQASAAVQVPLPEKGLSSTPEHSIWGDCEVTVPGESKPRPCTNVHLVLQSSREGEERTAVVDGFNFRFNDLKESKYKLTADSPDLQLETFEKGMLSPGQKLKIRLKAKPRP